MAQHFKDLSITAPNSNPFTGAGLTDASIETAGCCQGVGERVFQLEKNADTDLQIISTAELSSGDFVVKFRCFPSSDEDSIGFIFWRVDDHNYYELRLAHNTLNTVSINKVTNGVVNEIVADTTITALAGRVAYVRVKLSRTAKRVQVRAWLSSIIEPTSWVINNVLTQDIPATANKYGFSQASARSVDWHWFSMSDDTTPAYKTSIPANDTTIYPAGNLTVSGAGYYHKDDADGLGRPAVSATARIYHQQSGALISRGATDTSARFTRSDIKTNEVCYATFSPTDLTSSLETGILNLLMPAVVPTDTHTVPAGAPSAIPGTFYILHLASDAGNLARVGKTDGTVFTTSELLSVDDQLVGYRGFTGTGATKIETWTVTSVDTDTAGRHYQLVYVDQDIGTAPVIGTATYDDRVLYATITRRTPVATTLGALSNVTITSPQDKQAVIYESSSTSWKNKFPSITVDTDDFEGDGSSEAQKLKLKAPFSKSDQAKLDETYDQLRSVDETFSVTPAVSAPVIGYANRALASSNRAFGSVSGDDPPTFTVGINTYRILEISYGTIPLNKTLNIYVGGETNAVTTIPDFPDQLEFKVGATTYRARLYETDDTDKVGNSDAYRLVEIPIGTVGIFTSGTPIDFQVLLNASGSNRLLPVGGDNGDVLQIKNNTRVWDTIAGGAASRTPVLASLSVSGRAEATIATRKLGDSIKLYIELNDFGVREQVVLTGTANNTYRIRIRDTVTNAPLATSRPFTIFSSTNPTKVVFETFVYNYNQNPPNEYKITIEGVYGSATSNTLTNLSSIIYPRLNSAYDSNDNRNATRLNPSWTKQTQFRQFSANAGGYILPSSSSTSQPVTRSNLEAMAYWNLRSMVTVVSSTGEVANYRDYSYLSVVNSSSYRWTIPDATTPAYCCWDDTGQYFYYVTGGASPVLRCFDMGTSSSGTSPNPTRITSREFAVNALISGQTSIFGICFQTTSTSVDYLIFFIFDGSEYKLVLVNIATQATVPFTVQVPVTGATPSGLDYIYNSSTNEFRLFIYWRTHANHHEVRVYDGSRILQKNESFPLGRPLSSTIKDISVRESRSLMNPVYTAHNPHMESDSIRCYRTTDTINSTASLGSFDYLPLSVYDTTTPARYLYQIIEDTSNGKLYFLYGAQSRYWTDDSVLLVERRTSFDNPTVEATSPVYGNSYGWRTTAPLAGGFLKGTKIYCPQRNESGSTARFHSIDLSNNFQISTTPEFTVTFPSSASGNAFTCWGNGTTFWVQKTLNAYAFNVSDYTRDATKDIIGLRGSGWSSSVQTNTLTGDSEHIIACQPSSSSAFLYYYRKEDGVYVKSETFYYPQFRQGVFINQYVPSTLTRTEPNTRGFAYYSNARDTAVYGGVFARYS